MDASLQYAWKPPAAPWNIFYIPVTYKLNLYLIQFANNTEQAPSLLEGPI
jgi:hypothetical protein